MKSKTDYLSASHTKVTTVRGAYLTIALFISLLLAVSNSPSSIANGQEKPIQIIKWSELNQLHQESTAETAEAKTQKSNPSSQLSTPTGSETFPRLPDLGHFANYGNDTWLYTPPTQGSRGGASTSNQSSPSGRLVKIPGFIVPIEYEQSEESQKVSAFFLVPKFGAILFEAPPPQNQIIYVQLIQPQALDVITEAYWITGTLKSDLLTKLGTTASFSMKAVTIEPYSTASTVESE